MIDKFTKESLLFDFYGELLSNRKKQVMELYYSEDLSLSEIADQFGISKSSVHESLKSAEKSLAEYEEKLGMMKKHFKRAETKNSINKIINQVQEEGKGDKKLLEEMDHIKKLLDDLDG